MAYPSNQPNVDIHFLVDECLTPKLVQTAIEHGYFGQHVVAVGLGATPDEVICAKAVASGEILVTNNGRDFRRIYRRFRRHPGLVVLLPSTRWKEQVVLFEKVLRFIEEERMIIDRVVQVRDDGSITIQPWTVETA